MWSRTCGSPCSWSVHLPCQWECGRSERSCLLTKQEPCLTPGLRRGALQLGERRVELVLGGCGDRDQAGETQIRMTADQGLLSGHHVGELLGVGQVGDHAKTGLLRG